MSETFSCIVFVALIVLAVVSAVPLSLKRGFRAHSLKVPFLTLVLYGLYEVAIKISIPPENVPIRVDLIIIIPCLAFTWLAGAIRLGIVFYCERQRRLNQRAAVDANTRTALQAFLIIPLFVLFAAIVYVNWG